MCIVSHLAVGVTSGQLVIMSWCFPTQWSRDKECIPQYNVLWNHCDGMAVRHIAWEKTTLPLVLAKFSPTLKLSVYSTGY